MQRKFSSMLRNGIKASQFWQDNQLVLREVKYFPWIAALSILFPLLAAVCEGIGMGFLLAFLQSLVGAADQPFQTGVQWFDIWVLGIHKSATERLYRVSGLILLSTWVRACFNYLSYVFLEMAQVNLVDRLRKRIFEQLQALSLGFFSKSNSGEIINVITTETTLLQQILQTAGFVLTKGLALIAYIVVVLQISWQLTLISTLLFTLVAVGLTRLNRIARERSFPVSQANSRFTAIAMEFINGIRTVQAFATQDFERQRYYQASTEVVRASTYSVMGWGLVRPLAEGLATTVLVGMIIVGMTVFVANGTLQIAALLTFLFTLFRLVPAIHEINGGIARIASLHGAVKTIEELLKTSNKPYLQNGRLPFSGLQQSLEFISVDFSYDATHPVLQNITLTIPQGQMIALVGASGAGKTTLADLIPRFYDPTAGLIQIDGIDLRQFDLTSLRRKIAVVSQDTFIFNASVRDNIAYGLANVSDTAVSEAARLANALEFIENLPQRFDTQLGDRGVRLSGGQRQRLAIARALLRDPEILILDEATSALDSVSERLIQASLEKLSVGRTVIAIAHRLSTITRADKVVVLEQGQIVEQGSYRDLLQQRGVLWKYHQMQHELEPINPVSSQALPRS
ncbi:ABC transporter ATP-binding protein [Leptolyngbya sp. NK1-12]|uniref:ABC transporter ATP-binding protein n=1 Tax=Leptolyngbya sp. NK1-12 TaxID=2547451 RepID=A0AA96WLF0_9CYAN|nr:ABC transporter ATP-binding protein [Leptolyngbya sp. NK1-12]